jgi:hypothetical protein
VKAREARKTRFVQADTGWRFTTIFGCFGILSPQM